MIVNGFDINPQNGEAGTYEIGISPTAINEGIDKEVQVDAICGDKADTLTLIHEGMRQPYGLKGGGIFRLSNGGRFGVLKSSATESPKFEEIEYVTFDGTLIYDTMLYGNNKTEIYIKFKRTNVTTPTYLFGCDGTSTTRLNAYLDSNGYWRYGNYSKIFNTRSTSLYEAAITPSKITVNDVIGEFTPNTFSTPHTMSLGGYTTTSGTRTAGYRGYIYYFQVLVDGELIADWIPVRRLSDGMECFWDKVTESFIEPL